MIQTEKSSLKAIKSVNNPVIQIHYSRTDVKHDSLNKIYVKVLVEVLLSSGRALSGYVAENEAADSQKCLV